VKKRSDIVAAAARRRTRPDQRDLAADRGLDRVDHARLARAGLVQRDVRLAAREAGESAVQVETDRIALRGNGVADLHLALEQRLDRADRGVDRDPYSPSPTRPASRIRDRGLQRLDIVQFLPCRCAVDR
jgi:hypothetical protein